jgi:hypothetical protein
LVAGFRNLHCADDVSKPRLCSEAEVVETAVKLVRGILLIQ